MLPVVFLLAVSLIETVSAAPWRLTDLFPRSVRRTQGADSAPIAPKLDPWYAAPDGWEDAAPGDVLSVRTAQGNLAVSIGTTIGGAYNILYRTTDSRSQPTWAVTTLVIPTQPNATSNSLLGYTIPYDSADLDASPSYTMSVWVKDGRAASNALSEIAESLDAGWYVTIPDYEGPLASFIAGVNSGHATLDALRASVSTTLGLPGIPDAKVALWGYSGGALASEWAAELQGTYAPELDVAGYAVGGLTPDVFNVFNTVTSTYSAGLIPPGVVGLLTQWPTVQELLYAKLKTTGNYTADTFLSVVNMTLADSGPAFAFQNIYDYFENGEADFEDPAVQAVIQADGQMGNHGVPQAPMFVYKAIRDEISPIADTDALVAKYCAVNGTVIQYERNTVTHHKDEQDAGSAHAFAFLSSVLDGTYVAPVDSCSITNVTIIAPRRSSTLSPPETFWDWADGLAPADDSTA